MHCLEELAGGMALYVNAKKKKKKKEHICFIQN